MTRTGLNRWATSLLALLGMSMGVAVAQETEAGFTDSGADSCLRCHDESAEYPVLDILNTRHGHRGDPGAPFGPGGLQCEACHGPGDEHAGRVRRGRERPAIPYFSDEQPASVNEENSICLTCHEKTSLAGWASSEHHDQDLRCTSCHQLHATTDAVTDDQLQAKVCHTCHKQQRADAYKASSHPVRFGEMACTDCHTPHSSDSEHALVRESVNATCWECHAEKRGPFLWEHPPASEDCTLCHRAHGSNHPALLTRRSPLLCQQCHSRTGHPALAFDGDELPGNGSTRSAFLLSRGCQNCHAQVHGSNHPSGTNLTR